MDEQMNERGRCPKRREGYENRKAEKKVIGRPRKEFETTEKEMKGEREIGDTIRKGRINS